MEVPAVVDGREPRANGIRPAWGLPVHFGTEHADSTVASSRHATQTVSGASATDAHAWSSSELRDPDAASAEGASRPADEHFPHVDADERAESVAVGADGVSGTERRRARKWQANSRWLYIAAGALMLLAVLYGVDLVTSQGKVPRGTKVAGVDVGSMSSADAESTLVSALGPKVDNPVALRAGAVSTELDPAKVGLAVDWTATLERAGEQPLNPFVRLISFFKSHEVGIVSKIPDQRLTSYLETMSRQANFAPREGAIWFDQAKVKSIMPLDGQKLRVEDSRDAILEHWLDDDGVSLPVDFTPTQTKSEQVRKLIDTVAEPAVSDPLVLMGSRQDPSGQEPPLFETELPISSHPEQGAAAPQAQTTKVQMVDPKGPEAFPVEFPRERIGEYLTFVRNGADIEPQYSAEAAKGILDPLLQATQAEGRDASFSFGTSTVTVEPAVRGRKVQWGPLLSGLQSGLLDRGPRTVPVTYESVDPKLTTEDAEKAGIREVVGEFTVNVGASSSAQSLINAINGHLVKSGESANLSELATTVSGDSGADGIATAFFNAAYEAGMTDLQRTQRSSPDSAFPAARDASAAANTSFRNPQGTGIVIQAAGGGSAVQVKLWGTKQFQVSTQTRDRIDVKKAGSERSTAANCTPESGRDGYTAEAVRTVDQGGREVSRDTFRSTYAPVNGVTCDPRASNTPSTSNSPGNPPAAPPPPAFPFPIPEIVIPGITPPR